MGKRPRGAASSGPSSGPATAKCFLGGLSQLTDSDKLVKYVQFYLYIYYLPEQVLRDEVRALQSRNVRGHV